MLKRRIESKLLEWKNNPDHKPLIIKGIRQSGKTFSVLKFANENYKSVIYINFQQNAEYKKIFEANLNIDNLKIQISTYIKDAKFIDKDTIIILDEIQECPQARTSLKFFKIDGRYDVIATGSLLGISGYNDSETSVPVGYEEDIQMYPLDFEEFLWAKGINEEVINELEKCFYNHDKVPIAIHDKMRELILQYIVVGGMPEAVDNFISSNNINEVNDIKRKILNSFIDDMVKYAKNGDKSKIRECFLSIPTQLAKVNKKFQYSLLKKKATKNDYIGVIEWLEDYGIIKRCYKLNKFDLPLNGNIDPDKFKVYVSDIGLLVTMLEDDSYRDILEGNLSIYKGAIYENLFADFLIKKSKNLYYYQNDSQLEIDFVMKYEREITICEVKAKNGNSKSLRTVLENKDKYNVKKAIKIGDYNIGDSNDILTIPFYLTFALFKQ